ncbi:MAG TPA: beta-galactosidase trimerization domain-containing protein [Terriglobia bacterium]|nr:beta-galactosidase trimerization domain-containing protein [Terriglobia bacterium]
MKRSSLPSLSLILSSVLIGLASACTFLAGPTSNSKNDIPYSTAVATPHVNWATKLDGGPIKGFFIPSITHGRDMVELMQRLSLDPTTVSIDRNWDVNCWGIGDFYGHETRGDIDDFQIVYNYVERDLTSDARFEVLMIPGLNGWSRLTRPSREAILRRVKEGAGIVLIHPFVGDVKGHPFKGDEPKGDPRIWDLSALVECPDDFVTEKGYPELNQQALAKGQWEISKRHFITEGSPLDLIPSGIIGSRFYRYRSTGDVLIKSGEYPILAVKNYGKGRVVSLAYVEEGFIPESINPVEAGIYWDYWEYQYSLLTRCLLWAARREGDMAIASLTASPQGPTALRLKLRSPRTNKVELEVAAKSEFGMVLGSYKKELNLGPGESELEIPKDSLCPSQGWPGGRQIFDLIVRNAVSGATLNWASTSFVAPKRATVTGIRPNAEVYRDGETMSIVAEAAGELADVQMRVKVMDDIQRLLFEEKRPTQGERYFFCPLKDFVGKSVQVTAELVDSRDSVIDQLRSKPLMVMPRARRQKEYRALLSFETPRHYFASTRQKLLHATAIDSGLTWGGALNNNLDMPRGYFGVYWYDRGPTSAEGIEKAIAEYQKTGDFDSLQYLTKKELYKRTGDKKYLIRTPSLDDPKVMELLASTAKTVARDKAMYNMDYYFVGDEGSLTSYTDPVDFCWGPYTLANFRSWLKQEYGSLDALNHEWKSTFTDWDSVIPLTTEEATRSRNFPPWADHRTYMEISFSNAYRQVRKAVVEGDPEGHIALSGTQVTTPYNGCDWYRLDQVIDHFLSYAGGNQWDFHRSFAKPGAMVGFWTGYGSSGAGVRNQIWTAALNNVLFPNLFWSPSVVNPDFTLSKSGRDMGEVFRALRFDGIGKLLMEAERLGDGVAIHYSMPSVHAAGILGIHPSDEEEMSGFPANREGWVRSLADLGVSYDFLSYEQLEKGDLTPGRYKVMVLPFSVAISSREADALRRFAENGGVVIADAFAGMMDQHCAWREKGLLDDFFGIETPSPEQRSISGNGKTGTSALTSQGTAWSLNSSDLQGLEFIEAGIECRTGQPLLQIDGNDVAVVHQVGKGWAIYLNLRLTQYPGLRAKSYGGKAYRSLLSSILGHVGVTPEVKVLDVNGDPLGQATIAHFRFGDGEVVAVVKENEAIQASMGRDGVTTYNDPRLGQIARQEVKVKLPRSWYVRDLRSGDSLGLRNSVETTVIAGDALVLALTPSPDRLSIQGPTTAKRGDHPAFSLVSSKAGRHLVQCHFYSPDGVFLFEYARNVLFEGNRGSVVFPTALSDPPGSYRLKVTDVLSGAKDEIRLRLE